MFGVLKASLTIRAQTHKSAARRALDYSDTCSGDTSLPGRSRHLRSTLRNPPLLFLFFHGRRRLGLVATKEETVQGVHLPQTAQSKISGRGRTCVRGRSSLFGRTTRPLSQASNNRNETFPLLSAVWRNIMALDSSYLEENEVLGFMCNRAPEVSSHDTVPGAAIGLVKLCLRG